jgi:hypothetical protein
MMSLALSSSSTLMALGLAALSGLPKIHPHHLPKTHPGTFPYFTSVACLLLILGVIIIHRANHHSFASDWFPCGGQV